MYIMMRQTVWYGYIEIYNPTQLHNSMHCTELVIVSVHHTHVYYNLNFPCSTRLSMVCAISPQTSFVLVVTELTTPL